MFASCLNFQVLIKSLNFLKRTAKYFLANLENNSSLPVVLKTLDCVTPEVTCVYLEVRG